MMIKRLLTTKIKESLRVMPAVALLGPRQVGKTTLAQAVVENHDSVYLDLEAPSDLAKLKDPEAFLSNYQDQLVILDEIQRAPELFPTLRGLIDKGRKGGKRRNGRFLLLGSASMDLLQQSSESLAGRIAYLELGTFNGLEVEQTNDAIRDLWIRGGFPESYLAESDEDSVNWRRQFLRTYLERDIPQFGPRIPAETLRRFWTMLAHSQAGVFNSAKIASSLGVSKPTVGRYLDLMVDLLLVRRLEPWHTNAKKRVVKSPKIYVRDSGLAHSLLRIIDYESLMGNPDMGGSWEAFVIENLISIAPPDCESYFYATHAGAEIDLVLNLAANRKIGIEIKHSLTPSPSKGFHIACDDLGIDERYLVYSGSDQYRQSNYEVISLQKMMRCLY